MLEGYKQTEVGVIPNDWHTPMLGSVCTLVNGRGFKPFEWSENGLPIIRIQNLNGSDEFNYYEGHYDPKIFIEHGQLLFAWSGSRGTSFGPHVWSGGNALLNYHTWKMLIDTSAIESDFFFHALKALTKTIEDSAHGASALVHTQKGEMEKLCFPVPSNKKEQTAIANALSDVDALITSLEKLITKKRAIKTAAMQQLLTGKKRLPPFDKTHTGYKQTELGEIPEDWEVEHLGAVATSIGSGITSTKGFGEFPLYGSTGQIGTCKEPEYRGESILVARVGANAGLLNFVTGDYGVSDNTIIVKLGSSSDIGFYKYQLTKMNLNTLVFGSGQPLLTGSQLKAILLPLPKPEEQAVIAGVLSDIDKEIEMLEQRLKKTQQLKQGMMQELLTGRTRLI
jgi:type I restriction enzyme S subunit